MNIFATCIKCLFRRRYTHICKRKEKHFRMMFYFNCRLYKREEKQGKVSAAEAQFITILKENEIKLSEQRKSKHGGISTKLRGFLKPTGWKPMMILFLFFSFQQFSGIYITLFYAVTWFQVNINWPRFSTQLL